MKNMKKRIVSLCLAIIMLVGVLPTGVIVTAETTGLSPTGTLYAYPEFDKRIERDYMYTVSVTDKNGTTQLPVYNHAEDSRTVRNTVDVSADEYRRFSSFAFEGTVTVNIKVNCDFTSYSVLPSAKGLESTFDSATGTIKVTLTEPVYFMVRLDGMDSTNIALLADEPETDIPTAGENTYIIEGWHEVDGGILKLTKDNSTVYIAPGAVLNARIKVTANNCKIIGRGAIVDPYGDIYNYDEADAYAASNDYCLLFVSNADDTVIDGIHLLNSRAFNIEVQGVWNTSYAERTSVTNVKILSSQMSSDGIMFNYYVEDAIAERCFVYCGDNALNYEDNASYKDILVGTTCNAIFPQTDVRNSHLEDIYVFRAEDNIINTEYAGTGDVTVISDHTIKNLYAQDVTSAAGFLFIESSAKRVDGNTQITNVCLPKIDGIKDRFYLNIFGSDTGNHQITLTNVYVDGEKISSISTSDSGNKKSGYAIVDILSLSTWGYISYPSGHSFSYAATSDEPSGVKTVHKVTVNYQNSLNVFVGNYQVYFAESVQMLDETVYLPYREIKAHLRVGANANTILIGDVEYIAYTDLLTTKMVESVLLSDNNLVLTPINLGEDLLIPDKGISRFTEYRASHQYISVSYEDGDTVFNVTDKDNSDREGIYRVINEEIKKYGTGSYTLSFDVKTSSSSSKALTTAIDYGTQLDSENNGKLTHIDTVLSDVWQTVTLTFEITDALISHKNLALIIYDRDKSIDDFSVKNVALTKADGITAAYTVTWNVDGREINEKWVAGQVPQIDFDTANGKSIFVGWDKSVTAVTADVTYTAQYKSAGVEFVGAQVRGSDYAVRFVGRIADYQLEDLEELGFEITIGDITADCRVTKVYTSIMSNAELVYADENDSNSNTKFFTYCLSDIPANTDIQVRIYAVVNGQRCVGDMFTYIFTGNDVVLPGINLREDNSIEDTADFTELFENPEKLEIDMNNYINYRAALTNTYRKLHEDKELNVVYFGGSITAGHGATNADSYSWRGRIGTWLKQEFPTANINNINRAIGESGTYMGAHRVQMDIISAEPDLLFIEYSINDYYYKSTYQQSASQFETIIREVKTALPDTDIVTVLVTDVNCLTTNKEGKLHIQAQAHEDISKAYNISTIHVGRYLAALVDYSDSKWSDYAIDIVHLNDDGYEVYYQVIRKFMYNSLFNTDFSKPQNGFLMSPVVSEELFDGNRTYILPSQSLLEESESLGGTGVTWSNDSCFSNPMISSSKGRFKFDLPTDVLAIKFNGTEICAYSFKKDISWLVSVDGGEYKLVEGTSHNPIIFAQGLAAGEHIVRIKLPDALEEISIGAIFTRDATLATQKGTA